MNVLISGGTGLIGRALIKNLVKKGDRVIVLTRSLEKKFPSDNVSFQLWDAKTLGKWKSVIENVDAVVNLAGENLGSGRWTNSRKEKILQSRKDAGRLLTEAIREAENKPDVFIQASAIGIYGTSTNDEKNEESPLGADFLSNVGKQWENSSKSVEELGVRRVVIRTGIVLDRYQGAFPRMYLPFRLFVGGPIGSGKQWVSWIHIDDEVRVIDFALRNPEVSGPVNAVAPNPVTNAQFGKTLSRVIKRPYWIPVPGFVLKAVLGEMSTLVLDGQNVKSSKLDEFGFNFHYSELPEALRSLFDKEK